MLILTLVLMASGLTELGCLWLPASLKRPVLILLAVVILGGSIGIAIVSPGAWSLLLSYLSVFRFINLLRLIDGRKQADYLRTVYFRSTIWLVGGQLVVLALSELARVAGLSFDGKWLILESLMIVFSLVIAFSLRRALDKTRPQLSAESLANNYPALSVCIPARNETSDLEECLLSLVRSDYPKLEILVLDDCSQLKQTPEIIRRFAHDGVRFLEGQTPPEAWSAKNFAYEQLAEAASGEIVLFCGVDVRVNGATLRRLVDLKQAKHKQMISLMPVNSLTAGHLRSLLLQPVRYFWELALPRRQLNWPPVLSTCWLIDASALSAYGGFKAVSRSIIPERYFARRATSDKDGYSFLSLGAAVGLVSKKSFKAQFETAVRTKYPLIKQRLEMVAAVVLIEVGLTLLPIVLIIWQLLSDGWLIMALSFGVFVVITACLYKVVEVTYGHKQPLALIGLPLVALYDCALQLYSMWQYEFNEVIWKGRNVCIPVMRLETISALPPISSDSADKS